MLQKVPIVSILYGNWLEETAMYSLSLWRCEYDFLLWLSLPNIRVLVFEHVSSVYLNRG